MGFNTTLPVSTKQKRNLVALRAIKNGKYCPGSIAVLRIVWPRLFRCSQPSLKHMRCLAAQVATSRIKFGSETESVSQTISYSGRSLFIADEVDRSQ